MNKTAKKVWSIISTVLVVIVVLCAVFLVGSRLLGYQVYNVISGSMSPTYEVGDLIYVKKVDVNTIQKGDPITFVLDENKTVATHRVVAVDAENQCFYTKGETNDVVDPPVHFNNVIGVPKFSIPFLGYVADFVQHPPGLYITIGIFLVLIVLVFLPDLLRKKKKAKAGAENEAAPEEAERPAEGPEEQGADDPEQSPEQN